MSLVKSYFLRFLVSAYLATILVGGVAGCSEQQYRAESGLNQSQLQFGAALVRAPFESLRLNAEDSAKKVNDATELAVAQCMKERGFVYEPLAYRPSEPDTLRIGDVDFAGREGFDLDGSTSRVDPSIFEPKPYQTDAWNNALLGNMDISDFDPNIIKVETPDGAVITADKNSCVSIGAGTLYGDMQEWETVSATLEYLSGEVFNRIQADAKYVTANDEIRSCVANKGYGTKNSLELLTDLGATFGDKPLTPEMKRQEVDAAVAVAECENQAGMPAIYGELLVKYEADIADENQGTILRFSELQAQAEQRAREALASR